MGRIFVWAFSLILVVVAGSDRAAAQPDSGPSAADTAMFRTLMAEIRAAAEAEAAQLTADLAGKDVAVLMAGDEAVRVTRDSLDDLLAQARLAHLLEPELTTPILEEMASRLGIPVAALTLILAGEDDLVTTIATGEALDRAMDALRRAAAADHARVEAHIAELRDLARRAGELELAAAQPIPPVPPGAKPARPPAETVFMPPTIDGMAVDRCVTWATACDQPAADEFCRRQGLTAAVSFEWAYMMPTRVMGDGQVCNADYCGGFTRIVCR